MTLLQECASHPKQLRGDKSYFMMKVSNRLSMFMFGFAIPDEAYA